eukprot:TRINITY_DN8036_c0_g1_i1.p1 TRINITY_DN8036_c0_g1~~TRINITY_DN8036_c0_g1_i1.p1  ORF type:complete len:164 (+),score=32.21 TRINITY_DN8036_c0_g1_i1:48-539(+)
MDLVVSIALLSIALEASLVLIDHLPNSSLFKGESRAVQRLRKECLEKTQHLRSLNPTDQYSAFIRAERELFKKNKELADLQARQKTDYWVGSLFCKALRYVVESLAMGWFLYTYWGSVVVVLPSLWATVPGYASTKTTSCVGAVFWMVICRRMIRKAKIFLSK